VNAIKLGFGASIYLLVAMLIIAIMASAASYFLLTQNQALKDALTEQARSLSESLADGMRLGVMLEDKEYVNQVASAILGLPNILYVDVHLSDGGLLEQLGGGEYHQKLPASTFNAAGESGFYIGEEINGENRSGHKDFMVPVRFEEGGSEVIGFVRVGLSTDSITKKWRDTLATTIWATLLLVIIGCTLLYLPMRRIIRPLEQLSDGALKIGQGDLDFKISLRRKDEIGRLADNFNDMATSLRKQNAEIREKTIKMEKSESKFRQSFENIGQPLYINALDGRLIDCNQSMFNLFGYSSRKEMIDKVDEGSRLYAEADQRE